MSEMISEVRLIDANALMTNVCGKECGCNFSDCELECDNPDTRCVFREYVEVQPTIETEPARHGRWIVHTTWHGMFGLIHSECSECKFDRNGDLSSWKFCPNCGVKMDLRTPTEAALDMADSVMMGGADNG